VTAPKHDAELFYDALAGEFEKDYYGDKADPCIKFDVAWFEQILANAIEGRQIRTAVEVGSGSGHWLEWLEARGIQSVGVDLSEEMCRRARARGLTVLQADAAALPIATDSCDLVVSPYCALDHCPDYREAFAEIDRVARPTALAVIMVDNAERMISRYWHVASARVRSARSDPRKDGRWIHTVDGTQVAVYTKLFSEHEVVGLMAAWNVEMIGIGLLTPLVPRKLRLFLPRWLMVGTLRAFGPVERYLCRKYPRRGALSVYIGRRGI
jgi:SAM-dependent methyltransferase